MAGTTVNNCDWVCANCSLFADAVRLVSGPPLAQKGAW